MSNEEMEIQLWSYIDGTSTQEERVQIEQLIATDKLWAAKHEELLAYNKSLFSELKAEAPEHDFSAKVLTAVQQPSKTAATSKHIMTWCIRGVAAFFIISIIISAAMYFSTADFGTSTAAIPKISLPDYMQQSVGMMLGAITLIFTLMMADSFFRNRLAGKHI